MKRNKNTKQKKSRLAMLSLAAIIPMATTGAVACTTPLTTNAVVSSSSYTKSYVEEVSLSNNNFNSSSSTSALNTYPSGWTSQLKNTKTTSGVVNTGSTFQNYMSGTLYLSKNPHANSSDNRILMINSRTEESGNYAVSHQGYKSNSVSLAENSFYSFQVAFKTDTNYETKTEYVIAGTIGADENLEINQDTFKSNPTKTFLLNEDGTFGNEYISFSYKGKTFYLRKTLQKFEEKVNTTGSAGEQKEFEFFYEDDLFYGFLCECGETSVKKPVYVKKVDTNLSEDQKKISIKTTENEDSIVFYECPDLTFSPRESSATEGVYKVKNGIQYYRSKTVANELNGDTRGSIYLNGLVDENGNEVKAEYVSITSKEWVTFYFFVATGNKAQTVDLELWLGSKNLSSSGVVFFDDVRINRYSENAFWKTYKAYFDNGYDLLYDTNESKHQNCTKFVDLRSDTQILFDGQNLDFEEGIFNDTPTSLKGWKKDESTTGKAQIFDVNFPNNFVFNQKNYGFVGSDLSCEVEFEQTEEEFPRLKVKALDENNYALGLFSENESAKVTKENSITIESKKIYKISAKYKFSELSEGNAYLFVKENVPEANKVLSGLVEKGLYTVAEETSTSGTSANASNKFANDWGTIEFYVKGGNLYDSAIDISLGLGKADENATGFVLFDNVKIEYASSEDFDNASSKLELGTSDSTADSEIPNGEFNFVKVSKQDDGIYDPQNWTITKGNGFLVSGVISTTPDSYEKYRQKYDESQKNVATSDINNPYYWASFYNPNNRFGDQRPDNVLMLGNMTESWQKLKSESFTISTDTAYKLSFHFLTNNSSTESGLKVSLVSDNGLKLYEMELPLSSIWKEHDIYFKSFPGEMNVSLEIEYGSQSKGVTGVAYFDGFNLDSENVTIPSNAQNVVDMSDFGMNLPTNNITSDRLTSKTETFTSATTSGENYSIGTVIKGEFDEKSPYLFDNETDGKSADKNFFYLEVGGRGSQTITSNFNIDLKASTYYVLSFKVKTHFNYLDPDFALDEEKTYDYGVTFGLTGFKYLTNLVSNDKDFQEYKIFINAKDATTAQLYMALICDSKETAGSAAIFDVALETTTEDEFNDAKNTTESGTFDVNNDKVFVSEAEDSSDDNTEEPESPDETTEGGENFNWLLIPTLITALAIVIAVVGYFLRKIKIKKIQIKKRNSYDRKTSANVDLIKRKAAEERDKELQALENSKTKFEDELARLETAHKSKVVGLREKDKNAVSKETDKEFKIFAKKRTVIAEKIDVLSKQIEETNSPEHLLNLERKIYAEQESAKRELQKASKKAEKEKAKNTDADKQNKK